VLDAMQDEGGVVTWLNGPQLQAVFGAFGQHDPNGPERSAIQAAKEAVSAVKRESRRRGIAEQPQLFVRIGVASGQVALGNIGSSRRTLYTAIGEPVELARQAAEITQPQQVLITEQAYRKVESEVGVDGDLPLVCEDGREIKAFVLL
jgi:adenylate cyclase